METLKVKYVGRGHTIVKLNGNQVKVKEGEIIVIPSKEQDKFLSNAFQVAGSKDEKLLETLIDKIEREIKDEDTKTKAISKTLLDEAKKQAKALEESIKPLQETRKARIEELKTELVNAKDEKVKLAEIKDREIQDLIAEKEALDKDIAKDKAPEKAKTEVKAK